MGMKIVRFRSGNSNTPRYGVVKDDEVIEIRGSIYTKFRLTDSKYPLGEVTLLPTTDAVEIWRLGLRKDRF
jgi:hypothetical protein